MEQNLGPSDLNNAVFFNLYWKHIGVITKWHLANDIELKSLEQLLFEFVNIDILW